MIEPELSSGYKRAGIYKFVPISNTRALPLNKDEHIYLDVKVPSIVYHGRGRTRLKSRKDLGAGCLVLTNKRLYFVTATKTTYRWLSSFDCGIETGAEVIDAHPSEQPFVRASSVVFEDWKNQYSAFEIAGEDKEIWQDRIQCILADRSHAWGRRVWDQDGGFVRPSDRL
jgi:hypothetical protein